MKFIDEYHILYEKARIWENNYWMGIKCYKLPFDMMIIQELIVKTKPDFILETGTAFGGSAMFYASICELMDHGRVITCDINSMVDFNKVKKYKCSERIEWIFGSSTNTLVFDKITKMIEHKQNPKCMVILDSWHTMDHVYKEMIMYKDFVPVDGYMIVEDSHVSENPVPWDYDDKGPMGAINKFLEKERDRWTIDWKCEKHLFTFNPSGYLKKIK